MTDLLLSLFLSFAFVVACCVSYRVGQKQAEKEHQSFFCKFAYYAKHRHNFPASELDYFKVKWVQKFGDWSDSVDIDAFNIVWNVVNKK